MEVIVTGGIKTPILLKTSEATAILINTDDGNPTVIFRMLENGKGWLRLVKGEDKNFDDAGRELGLT